MVIREWIYTMSEGIKMFCRKCGKEIVEGGKFCRFCGANVSEEEFQTTNISLKENSKKSSNKLAIILIITVVVLGLAGVGGIIVFMTNLNQNSHIERSDDDDDREAYREKRITTTRMLKMM